jgi:hypothetical protein
MTIQEHLKKKKKNLRREVMHFKKKEMEGIN